MHKEDLDELVGPMVGALNAIAKGIYPGGGVYVPDGGGGIASVTEALIYCGEGLNGIANALERIAEHLESGR